MNNPTGSTVSEVKVRTSGHVLCKVDVFDAGTPEVAVALRIGDIMCRISSLHTLNALHYQWSIAEQHVTRLPHYVEPQHLGATPGLYRVGVLVDLQGRPTGTVAFVPAHGETPAHMRLQFGPIVWQVLDRAAFVAVLAALGNALDTFDNLAA